MVEAKRTIKTDMVIKNARVVNGQVVDEDGMIIELTDAIAKIYGEDEFKLTLTRSTSEEIDVDDLDDEE